MAGKEFRTLLFPNPFPARGRKHREVCDRTAVVFFPNPFPARGRKLVNLANGQGLFCGPGGFPNPFPARGRKPLTPIQAPTARVTNFPNPFPARGRKHQSEK